MRREKIQREFVLQENLRLPKCDLSFLLKAAQVTTPFVAAIALVFCGGRQVHHRLLGLVLYVEDVKPRNTIEHALKLDASVKTNENVQT